MTKLFKIASVLISFLLISFFIFAAFFIQNKTTTLSSSYEARKEDLLASQKQLEILVSELNRTLQIAQAREQNLSNQVAVLENKASQPIATPIPAQPTPTPIPTPVTRAS